MMCKKYGITCNSLLAISQGGVLSVFIFLGVVFLSFRALSSETYVAEDSVSSRSTSSSPTDRNRFEEMFIWKMSEELDLEVKEEKKFSDIIKLNNRLRVQITVDTEEALKKLSSAQDKKTKENLLADYKKLLTKNSQVMVDELDQLTKELGTDKAARYLILKNEMVQKLRNLVMSSDRNKKSGEPETKVKITQEK